MPGESLARRITVADCEQSQTACFRDCARVSGGEAWDDGPLPWVWLPATRSLLVLFPRDVPAGYVARGINAAEARGAREIGAWLSLDVDAAAFVNAGFEHGWSPWWMTAPLDVVSAAVDPRIRLETETPEYDDPGDIAQLSLTREDPPQTWHAAARVDGRFAGRTFAHRRGDVAGIFNMAVWPPFRRRGLGTGLLRTACAAAAAAGARDAVLNATPDRERLYATSGFTRIGDGITYWLHRR